MHVASPTEGPGERSEGAAGGLSRQSCRVNHAMRPLHATAGGEDHARAGAGRNVAGPLWAGRGGGRRPTFGPRSRRNPRDRGPVAIFHLASDSHLLEYRDPSASARQMQCSVPRPKRAAPWRNRAGGGRGDARAGVNGVVGAPCARKGGSPGVPPRAAAPPARTGRGTPAAGVRAGALTRAPSPGSAPFPPPATAPVLTRRRHRRHHGRHRHPGDRIHTPRRGPRGSTGRSRSGRRSPTCG